MPRIKAKKIVEQYARALKKAHYPFSAIYLFGSYAKRVANKWSDIDIAIVSNKLKTNRDVNSFLLWKVRRTVDTRIEPHGFTAKEFMNDADPMVHEIKKTGLRVK